MAETTSIPSCIYKAMVDSSPHAIIILNERSEILFCNDIFPSLFGLTLLQVYLKRIDEIIPDRGFKKLVNEVKVDGVFRETELLYEMEGGEKKILKVFIKKMPLTAQGIKDVLLITLEDISEKMRLEAETIQTERLENMVQIARVIAHELGNTLYSVKSTLQFIKEEKMLEKDIDIAPDVDFLLDSVNNMTSLLTMLINFSYSERLQFNKEDIHRIINRAIAILHREAIRRHVLIDTDLPGEVPLLWMDKRQIEHVFLNLLKNAIESMPEGGEIWIKTSFHPEISDEKAGSVVIEISDTGVGISEEDLKYIFKPLFSTKMEGHGLGLYICKEFVERLHGTITVQSEKGKGTVFTIKIPMFYLPPEQTNHLSTIWT